MLSVFTPAYDEEQGLERNVRDIMKALEGLDYELFIVDDGSADGTPEICRKLESEDMRVRHLRYENGPSRRENLATSFKQAKGEYVAFIDSDLGEAAHYLPGMAEDLGEYDISMGCRTHPESRIGRSVLRRAYTHLSNGFIRAYFGSRLRDHQCGLKAFRRDVILRLVDEAGYDESGDRGWSWDTEILLRAQRHGYMIREFPVSWVERRGTTVKLNRDWSLLKYVFKLKRIISK
ncbi:MAG: glycosyltransferase [Candidatus Altiarchaeales archaeon]|nr:glycosyltransferase [Candidatus Altiarchaeales archaeon]MBD3417092.1 glycosyltransferase [Candidatus Altiarchaeales archaeon]